MLELEYPRLIENALRGVVRNVLREISEDGLPGEHHLLLTFRTCDPGVELPTTLLAEYPEEMTIVLQHQFRDLIVADDSFSVYLQFSGVEHGVTVPFGALTAFADPSVSFGLQFRHLSEFPEEATAPEIGEATSEVEASAKVLDFQSFRKE